MVTAAVGNDVISALLCCDWLHSLSLSTPALVIVLMVTVAISLMTVALSVCSSVTTPDGRRGDQAAADGDEGPQMVVVVVAATRPHRLPEQQ